MARKRLPDAFEKKNNFPHIKRIDGAPMPRPVRHYKMGKTRIMYCPPTDTHPALLTVARPDRNPTWDEMVWVRYNVAPEIEDMALILPPLHEYINYDSGYQKHTFTMEAVDRSRTHGGK